MDWNTKYSHAGTFPVVVTPLVGVWIEISLSIPYINSGVCHSPCGSVDWNRPVLLLQQSDQSHSPCGSVDWNSVRVMEYQPFLLSLPLWECGLKLILLPYLISFSTVTPLVGVWIEICLIWLRLLPFFGHSPCGSVDWNFYDFLPVFFLLSHSPCGSVDWNNTFVCFFHNHTCVTPLVGVWIEIMFLKMIYLRILRHSPCGSVDWNINPLFHVHTALSHSPCGSVDWNIVVPDILRSVLVTPLVGVWIEICRQING